MKTSIVLGIALLSPFASWAADTFDAKPGLWEFTTNVTMSGMANMISPDQLANLPEATRKKLEAMGGAPQTATRKSCVTKEGIADAIASANRQNDSCTTKAVTTTSSKVEVHMECNQEKQGQKTVGDFSIDRVDGEHIKGQGAMKSTGSNGRSMDMKWSMTAKFLTSDCGDVKPSGK